MALCSYYMYLEFFVVFFFSSSVASKWELLDSQKIWVSKINNDDDNSTIIIVAIMY